MIVLLDSFVKRVNKKLNVYVIEPAMRYEIHQPQDMQPQEVGKENYNLDQILWLVWWLE